MHRALLVAALLALAGCLGGGGGAKHTDGVTEGLDDLGLHATEDTGVLRGVVVDEAIKPLAGVHLQVRSPSVNRSATTNQDGLFGLEGLEPGDYFVTASLDGYVETQAGPVTVVAGVSDPDAMRISLQAVRSAAPFYEEFVFEGFLACSVTSPSVSAAVCGLPGLSDASHNQFLKNYQAQKPPAWIQMEAIWESTQPFGGELGLSITALGPPQVGVNDTQGTSPIYITVNETEAARFHFGVNDTDISLRLFSSELTGTDVVPEEVVQDAYAANVYGPVNGTGAPKAIDDNVIAHDPTCPVSGCLLVNPLGNPDCVQYPVLFHDCYRFGGVGFTLNQQVKVFTHIFYGYAPPAGWRFSEAPVPQPP